jgi:Protein of unknown function (DUF2934)
MAKEGSKQPATKMVRHIFSSDRSTSTEGLSREKIAQRAYELYLARGGAHGSELEDWLQAERELHEQNKSTNKGPHKEAQQGESIRAT